MEAFEDIVKDYSPRIYYFFRSLGMDHEAADEATEEVFISYWRDLKSGHGLDAVGFRLYKHVAKKVLRPDHGSANAIALNNKLVLLLKLEGFDSLDISEMTGLAIDEVRKRYQAALAAEKSNDES